ncbi:MAG: hypothetical protein ACI8WT_003450 [Clostridium sp.]|jgi:hypothetical protein
MTLTIIYDRLMTNNCCLITKVSKEEKMLKIWGKLINDNRIIMDEVSMSEIDDSYQENLKACITELCYKFDISTPYWLKSNINEYNKRRKTSFDENNFIDEIQFDKFMIEELKPSEK